MSKNSNQGHHEFFIRGDLAMAKRAVPAVGFTTALLGVLCILAGQVEAASGGTVEARQCLPMARWESEELRELDAAAELLKQSGYFDILMRTTGVEICVYPLMTFFRGHYEPDEHVIVIGANASLEEKALILAHELRHVDQAARGFAPSIAFDLRENVRQIFALEADAQAITVLFAWSMREAGNPSLWQALKTLEHAGDMAAPFEAAMQAGEGQAAATRAAFLAWYQSPWRVENYSTAAVGAYLDQLDESRSIQSYRELPRGHFDGLCLMPNGGDYACGLPTESKSLQQTLRSTRYRPQSSCHVLAPCPDSVLLIATLVSGQISAIFKERLLSPPAAWRHLLDSRDGRDRRLGQFPVFPDGILIHGAVDAVGALAREVGVLPLDLVSQHVDRGIRALRDHLLSFERKIADAGDRAFDHVYLVTVTRAVTGLDASADCRGVDKVHWHDQSRLHSRGAQVGHQGPFARGFQYSP